MVTGRVRQVVVLYSNDCMGIDLGGLSIDHFIELVIQAGLTVALSDLFLVSMKVSEQSYP